MLFGIKNVISNCLIFKDYLNRDIRITSERLNHILLHPEMNDAAHLIEETLINPQLIIQSKLDLDVDLYYREYFHAKIGNKWLCVVVKFLKDDVFVMTAYYTDKPKKGKLLWDKN